MSRRFELVETGLPGLRVAVRKPVGDARGWLERVYCADDLRSVLGERTIVQINRTLTGAAGTVRGLHFQHPPAAEIKLVSCLRGKVMDVAVDVRRGSPTFLRWHAEVLSAENRRTLIIPEGFAHGFQTLADHCELLYLHTAHYAPELEDGLNAMDPRLAITWPRPVTVRSERDRSLPSADDVFQGVAL